jgi:GT2 family glycosyltransferase
MKYKYKSNYQRIQDLYNVRNISLNNQNVKSGISVIILNLDKPEYIIPLTKTLLAAQKIFQDNQLSLEIIIGDTGSTNSDVLELYQNPNITVETGLRYHFSKNNNFVAEKHASCEFLLFMNNDIEISKPEILFDFYLKSIACPQEYGIFGHCLLFPDSRIQHAGIVFFQYDADQNQMPVHIWGGESIQKRSVPAEADYHATTGAFLMIKRKVFLMCRGFDERYHKEAQDIDLCLSAVRLGYRVKVYNLGVILHFENGTRVKGEESNEDRSEFVRSWSGFIMGVLQK